MNRLRQSKKAQTLELHGLDAEIGDLNTQIGRCKGNLAHLKDEREILAEHVDQLDALVQKREEDLAEADAELKKCELQIESL